MRAALKRMIPRKSGVIVNNASVLGWRAQRGQSHYAAAKAGVMALKAGGNAVDAAIACALVQTGVDPQMCGIAGFGSMQLFLPSKSLHEFIDFHGRAPLAAREDMWANELVAETEDGFGFILKDNVNDIGYLSITSPGS